MVGTGGDYVEVDYDGAIVGQLLTKMGQYRISKAPFTPGQQTPDGRPIETNGNAHAYGHDNQN